MVVVHMEDIKGGIILRLKVECTAVPTTILLPVVHLPCAIQRTVAVVVVVVALPLRSCTLHLVRIPGIRVSTTTTTATTAATTTTTTIIIIVVI
jgi:hypothetical protein